MKLLNNLRRWLNVRHSWLKKERKKVGPGVKWPMGHATDDAVVPPLYIVKSHVIRLVYDRGQRLLIVVRFSKNKNKSKNKTKKKFTIQNICWPSSARILWKFPVSVTLCLKSKKIIKIKARSNEIGCSKHFF